MKMRRFTTKNRLEKVRWVLISAMMIFGAFIQQGQAQTCPLACNDNVQVTLDTNCLAIITPDMILEDPGAGCAYDVVVKDLNGNIIPGDSITSQYVGQTLPVAVYLGANSCWGTIKVEDKYPPTVKCPDPDTIYCHEFPGPDAYPWPVKGVASDACGNVYLHVVKTEWDDYSCDSVGISGVWRRWVYWTDESGNISDTCVLEVYLKRLSCEDLIFPKDTIFNCFDYQEDPSLTDPTSAGMPSFNGRPLYFPNRKYKKDFYACEIEVSYSDDTLNIFCPGSFKILRKWLCLDWCLPTGPNNPKFVYQIVKVKDGGLIVSAPGNCPEDDGKHCNGDLDCVDDYSDLVGMNYWSCKSKKFYLPDPFKDPRFSVQSCSKATVTKIGVRVARDPEVCAGATYPERFDLVHYDKVKGKWYAEDLPAGYNWLVYHFKDECNNNAEAKYDVYVYDDVPPNPVCDKHTVVALNRDGIAKLYATSVDDGSTDNCGIDSFAVRRMTDNCNIKQNLVFGSFVEFCCQDLMTTQMVVLKVIDKRGNENTCMVEVEVQDKLPPVVSCPPDVTVPCDFDLSDLSIFGTIKNVGKNEVRNKLGAATIKGLTWDVPVADRIDGAYNDNDLCNVDFKIQVRRQEYDCHTNTGWVKRTFVVTDKSGNSSKCTQTITIRETGKRFSMSPLKWKAVPDVTLTDKCASDYDLTPKAGTRWGIMTPEIAAGNARGCYTLAVNYTDKRFTLGSDACIKIIREWTVIDWCQVVNKNVNCGAVGVWCHTQVLKVIDDTPPAFTCNNVSITPEDDYDCMTDNLTARRKVTIVADATDDCAKDKLKWNYWIEKKETENVCRAGAHDGKGTWKSYSHGAKSKVSGYFPLGEYRIWVQVADQCGNVSECKWRYFDVLDQKKPTPYCRDGINTVIMPSGKSLVIWAKDFNLGSYDNCPEDRNVTFALYHPASGRWSNKKGDFVLDCSMKGKQKFWMYVYDQCGNKEYCEVILDLQDPNHVCDGLTFNMVSGTVRDMEGNVLPNVEVTLKNQTLNDTKKTKTLNNGDYYFSGLNTGNDYWVQPLKTDEPLKGVNTRDLVAIQFYLLGKKSFSRPEYFIAADANNDQKISTKDIIVLRRLILGKEDNFKSDQKSWRFIPKSFTFDDPLDPFPFADYISYKGLNENKVNTDFNAIKIGDLTGEAYRNLSGSKVRTGSAQFTTVDQTFKAGDLVEMPVTVQDLEQISGGQYTLTFNPLVLSLEDIESDVIKLNDDNFNFSKLKEGILNASWISTNTSELQGKVLFTIRFSALEDGMLSQVADITSDITTAEVYDQDLNVYEMNLRFNNAAEASSFALYQNKPNPFSNTTIIGFQLPKDGPVQLTVYDMSGKVLKVIEGTYSKGYNEIQIDQRELNATGVLYYQLDADKNTATRKMVLLR